jgi:opacity protein-like surface antigen
MSISLHRPSRRSFRPRVQKVKPTFRLLLGALLLTGSVACSAHAQTAPISGLDKQLDRIDLAVSGGGYFNSATAGKNEEGVYITNTPGNTLGALVTIRYVPKPYFGLEFNFGYARYTQNYSNAGGIQANEDEFTLGYVAHPPIHIAGLKPFLAVGLGTTEFKPTRGGGEGLPLQARASYYGAIGADYMVSPHIGLRAQYRETIELAPDFLQNYLTILQRTHTAEPAAGFFLKF